jgi:uncharacterized protein (DUF2062 family)
MRRKFIIEAICTVAVAVNIVVAAYAGNTTTLTDPITKDTVTLLTHDKGTYVKHANGLAGYIIVRSEDSAPPKDVASQHEYYVRVYEKRGYVKKK